jgi:hypothetical protein
MRKAILLRADILAWTEMDDATKEASQRQWLRDLA